MANLDIFQFLACCLLFLFHVLFRAVEFEDGEEGVGRYWTMLIRTRSN
jgi:hypothetical protein